MTLRRRVLLVSPVFHGYHRALSAELDVLGYDVTTHVYDAHPTLASKARTKLVHELPERFGHDRTAARAAGITALARAALVESRPDLLLVVKGDVLGDDFWDAAERLRAPSVLWLYDELRRTRWDRERLGRIRAIASYSSHDVADLRAQGLAATHVPLGFDTTIDVPRGRPTGEVTFIGARYAQRESLLTALAAAGVPVRAYGRDWSHDLRDRARTWGEARPRIPAGRDLAREDAYAVMRDGAATLNVHGDQDGFTMRTFEASGVGGLQLCDREDVDHYLDPGSQVLTFRTPEEVVEAFRRAEREPAWAGAIRDAGRARVLAEHTLAHRARALEALWG